MAEFDASEDRRGDAGPTRRNVLKGAAWATPVIAVAAAIPAVAASLPPCVSALATVSGGWSVGGAYTGSTCGLNQHFDVNFTVTITACNAQIVRIRIVDLPQYQGASHSRLWWDYITGANATAQLYVELPFNVPAAGSVQHQIVTTGNEVRRVDDNAFVGTIQQPPNNVNDGVHVNPCFVPVNGSGPVAQLWYAYDAGPLQPGPLIYASRP